ncbi:MAG: D-tyrosyl-tRNA(Tyr) deacylase [Deltaproteobacteria bacterium]|nr:D-tyrosyl-tRNA(Tyr) deacylase [Candidatus Anaeroferrophillus wilburensis]MBN2889352.1 D-tyrosyl-tRNA(Tyr) deacylase [Deltaproteobacteria bacterium]
MRAVVQRVSNASVSVEKQEVASIGRGFLVLLGVGRQDGDADVAYMVNKISGLRIFADQEGKMNRSLAEEGGEILLVSQFTLFGDVRKGTRPSFFSAADAEAGKRLYLAVLEGLKNRGIKTYGGRFQEMMEVLLVNDGPVTILLDSRKQF